ncbi:Eco57I restriction-modification methylase domain-containing protein [Clostridium magnum]|uniref:site-specific DNA-methyltransferase (adenine-specific) n=1 Tax=Clostridium magnum DSM 2767 TaxID=1121326 RepID=A0A161WJ16_9CLOT|nr:TaqI-like C-terminal specificity domain-containing protein [Clostridium magnum]KZL91705.1 type IIS restriction enzyme Eco57I [Clostridium magnum DSM 2767]SHJ39360.1 Methyltransferase domain-containing protein [Clostridium magnum DSM 2767]
MEDNSYIFNRKLLKEKLTNFHINTIPDITKKRKIISNWIYSIKTGDLNKTKEKSIQGDFLTAFFTNILGYKKRYGNGVWNIVQEQKTTLDATTPDGALGFFTSDITDIRTVIELKDANTNLDKKQKGRDNKVSPVDQAFSYVHKSGKKCRWVIVSNFLEIRLYHHSTALEYEKFIVTDLVDDEKFKEFYYLLCYDNLINRDTPSVIDDLYEKNEEAQKEITNNFYKYYKSTRLNMFEGLKENNPGVDEILLFEKSQKLMDRFIFVCFCEDKTLLPENTFRNVIKIAGMSYEISTNKIWTQLKGLFHAIDKGNPPMNINRFNGGLFAPDKDLDNLNIPDDMFKGLEELAEYNFDTDLNVDILGHIFEQSISDIEEIRSEIKGQVINKKQGKRKHDGIFYTPEYITHYIVEQTIGRWLEDRKIELGEAKLPKVPAFDPKMNASEKRTWKIALERNISFWNKYRDRLSNIKVIDYACGSGAFLNAAFDYLYMEGQYVNNRLNELKEGQLNLFPLDKHILKNNLYGIDLNAESVEITKLSLWLKTANKKDPLTSLDENILCGNSLIEDENVAGDKAFKWKERFKEIFHNGGFDIVIGTPPYGAAFSDLDKKYLDNNYKTTQYNYDSYKFFLELAFKITKYNSYVGVITPNTYMVLEKSDILRKFLFDNYCIVNLVEIFNVFPDAVVEPIISIFKHRKPSIFDKFQAILIPRNIDASDNFVSKGTINEFKHTDLYRKEGYIFNYHETKEERELSDKLFKNSKPLSEYATISAGVKPYEKGKGTPPQTAEVVKEKPYTSFVKEDDTWKPLVRGAYINRYLVKLNGEYIKYGECLAAPRDPKMFSNSKIFIRQTSDYPVAVYDDNGYVCNNTIHCIYLKPEYSHLNLKYFLALINSKLMKWIFQQQNFHIVGKPLAETKVIYVERLPIIIDKNQNQFIEIADKLILFNKSSYEREQKFIKYIQEMYKPKKISSKLEQFFALEYKDFADELKKQKVKLSEKNKFDLMELFNSEVQYIKAIKYDIKRLEEQLDKMIFKTYELTNMEINMIDSNNILKMEAVS